MMKRTLKSPKSRGGCQRCKAKHVKCDEAKPSCRMCTATGVECPGYVKQIRWSNKHEVYDKPRRRPQSENGAPIAQSSSSLPSNPLYQTPPAEDARTTTTTTTTSAQASDVSMTSGGPINEMDHVPEWPDIDLSGYEDFGFAAPLMEPSFDLASEGGLTYPFSFPLEDLMPNLANSPPDESPASASRTLSTLPARTSESEEAKRKSLKREASPPGSPSTGLLQTFYRLSQPSKVPGFSDHDLVSYYFSNICTVYSCFDSDINPFRTLTAEKYPKSQTVHLAVQFMSLANLANWYPYLTALGLGKRSEAWTSLQRDLQALQKNRKAVDMDAVMLSLLLLGPTAAWHQASSLGLQYLLVGRNILQGQLQRNDSESPHKDFFLSAMMYWEMLVSFVDPVPLAPLSGLKAPDLTLPTRANPMTPHPWSAVMDDVCFLLAEIGRVLRRQRGPQQTNLAVQRPGRERPTVIDEAWTKTLEALLLDLQPPSPDDIVDYDDPKTPRIDLTKMADAYRYVGLLEIYGAFPALLRETLALDTIPAALQIITPSGQSTYSDQVHAGLAAIAIHILDLVKTVAITSAACRLLPMILMCAASQLRLPPVVAPAASSPGHNEVIDARYVVEARMLVLSRKYAQKPVLQMVDIVKETWERLDAPGGGGERAHWMDVSQEKSWQTIFG